MSSNVTNMFETVADVMNLMAPFAGGTVPTSTSTDYANWLRWIQEKYEESSRRGFWRRLLTKDTVSITANATTALLPVRFQRANSMYSFIVGEVDLADPDREADDQQIFTFLENDPTSVNFGRWRIDFKTAIATATTATIWYFATPPKPTSDTDKLLLPADMIAFGALIEHFRKASLPGSQDDSRIEYENRLNAYLAMEMIPGKHEILKFSTNPRTLDRLGVAKTRFSIREERLNRSY